MLKRISLLWKIVLLVTILIGLSLTLAKIIIDERFHTAVNDHYGESAMIVAKMIANNREITDAFYNDQPQIYIQPIAENTRKITGASYIIVTDLDHVQYSHHDINQIGIKLDFNTEDVIKDEVSVIFQGIGHSGAATIAQTPIYDRNRQIIGVVTVGFYYDDLQSQINEFNSYILGNFFIIFLLGLIGAFLISRNVKNMIFGLEPEEISYLFKEKEAILESIKDPLIAVNVDGNTVTVNKKAREMPYFNTIKIGDNPNFPYFEETMKAIKTKTLDENNKKVMIDNKVFIMNYSPIFQNTELVGAVFIFHPYSELKQYLDEVSQIKIFTENMRAQNHEFQNKLNTIYGLFMLNKNDQALQLISQEVEHRQEFTNFLMNSVKNPLIAACLLGKKNKASELKVSLLIDENSELDIFPESLDEEDVMTILSNLIDNALEAAYRKNGEDGKVFVSFTDLGPDIIFDIEDNGIGISPDEEEKIFTKGYTTKASKTNGIGLSIVKNTLDTLNGQLYISRNSMGGASITVTIPKQNTNSEKEF